MQRSCLSVTFGYVVLFLLAGCGDDLRHEQDRDRAITPASSVLRLATTTSTRDSGLLDVLLPMFEANHDCRVALVAVGTGAALKLGESGDADVLLVHVREAEEAFMAAGHGVRHEEFMTNHFAIVGPAGDPAAIRETRSAAEALRQIAKRKQRFISRGDDSGTHLREQALWREAGGRLDWEGYVEGGQGMGATLVMADEMQAYTLTDLGTYLKLKERLDLLPLTTRSDSLRNPYSVLVVNPKKNDAINSKMAHALVDFLVSTQAQDKIEQYRVFGQQLFQPARQNITSPDD